MLSLFAAALLTVAPHPGLVVCLDDRSPVAADDFRALYTSGVSYEDFLAAADRRRGLWLQNTLKADGLSAEMIERARAVGGTWRFLVVAVAACSDSVSIIPYLAELVSVVDGLDMRIVDSSAGRAVMEAHRTPDGRAATPTVLLLDSDYEERGCFIERPRSLQSWIIENQGRISSEELFTRKMAWYDEDAGSETVAQLVEILEAAAAGRTLCEA